MLGTLVHENCHHHRPPLGSGISRFYAGIGSFAAEGGYGGRKEFVIVIIR
jgi:hypothetical protein